MSPPRYLVGRGVAPLQPRGRQVWRCKTLQLLLVAVTFFGLAGLLTIHGSSCFMKRVSWVICLLFWNKGDKKLWDVAN